MRTLVLCSLVLLGLITGARAANSPVAPPVPVTFQLFPTETQLFVDGVPIEWRAGAVELVQGRHRVDALAPPSSGYASRSFVIEARPGMAPVRRALQQLAQLHVQAPLGYQVRIGGQAVAATRESGVVQDVVTALPGGIYRVTAESWRGRRLRANVELHPGRAAEVRLSPPSLVPGAVLAAAGLVGVAIGATFIGLHGTCFDRNTAPLGAPRNCASVYDFGWQTNAENLQPPSLGYLSLAIGAGELIAGTIWFAVNAANHPSLRRREGGALPRLPRLAPLLHPTGGALVMHAQF